MLYLLLFVGLILMIIFTPEAVRQVRTSSFTGEQQSPGGELSVVLESIQALDDKLSLIQDSLDDLQNMMQEKKFPVTAQPVEAASFEEILIGEEYKLKTPVDDLQRAVCQAYEAGHSVTEIARDFGKGKGEIELILSLRR